MSRPKTEAGPPRGRSIVTPRRIGSRGASPSVLASLACLIATLGPSVAAAAPPDPGHTDLGKLIVAIRAEEAKFRDVEYTLRIATREVDPRAPEAPGEVTLNETRRVVLQGDRIFYRGLSSRRVLETGLHRVEQSACDGERTRTVIAGNCVNIHFGRFEHPNVHPVHCLPLDHDRINFPLSVYLGGTDTIHAHPKYPRFLRETGTVYEFAKVEASIEGEEPVDGLRCVKVRVDRWYRSGGRPARQYLWLAPERNHQCVKERVSSTRPEAAGMALHEMHVDEFREVAPGVWFPARITVVDHDRAAIDRKRQVVRSRTTTTVDAMDLTPRHALAFFRDLKIPEGLPVITIRDGAIVGSSLPEPIPDEAAETAKLAEVVARVREQERRYADLEVKARARYEYLGGDSVFALGGLMMHREGRMRSVLRGPLAYYSEQQGSATLDGTRTESRQAWAFDGSWTRRASIDRDEGKPEQAFATLRKGGGGKTEGRGDGIPVLRPHTFLLRDDWMYGPLADTLVSPWHDKNDNYRMRFRYCGEEIVDGHPCIRLRAEVTTGEGRPPSSFMAIWLATDRNLIPIKLEHYGGNHGLGKMPGGIYRCEDLREIAPGLWYPFRSTLLAFDAGIAMPQGRVILNWRRDYEVESATPSPVVDGALFRDVVVPAGTKVNVSDEDGRYLGEYEQGEASVAGLTPAQFLKLRSEAKARDEQNANMRRVKPPAASPP